MSTGLTWKTIGLAIPTVPPSSSRRPGKALRLACAVFLGASAVRVGAETSANGLERLSLSVNPGILYIARPNQGEGAVVLTGFYANGSSKILPPGSAVLAATNKSASGHAAVAVMEGDKVAGKEGGIARIEARVAKPDGTVLTAATDVVVSPFYRDYNQTLVLKLFMGMDGEPVDSMVQDPVLSHPNHDVFCTFAQALDVIRKTDNLTRGIPKIIYLVGWQKGGHDHLYPAWSEVNPKLKRPEDHTALDSLRWLIRAARPYHTTVSLHINMLDAYQDSPLWDEYLAKDCIARDTEGRPVTSGIAVKGEPMYAVVYPKEWEAGLAQCRIDDLIRMVPELSEGHTIHIDAFEAQREHGKPISPWHAMPEQGGLMPAQYVETQGKIFHYWRARGFDVTGEGIFWAHPRGEGFTGWQAMSWWYPDKPAYQMEIPECLMARGRTSRTDDGDFRFGASMHGEEIYREDRENLHGFLGMFCRTTLPWYYLSRLQRLKFANGELDYSDGVVARVESGRNIIRRGDFVLRENDDLFVPALWHAHEIMAYSRNGFQNKVWRLPEDWKGVENVDLYRITLEGCVPLAGPVPLVNGTLALTLGPDEAVSIVPSGTPLSGTVLKAP